MKKVFAIVLALTMVLTMGMVAFAANNGTITITNAMDGATYDIYQMATFTPSNTAGDKGIYVALEAWEGFFTGPDAATIFDTKEVDDKLVVSLKKDVTQVSQDLAKAAIAYAEKNTIAATKTDDAEGTTVEFTSLALGYYAIDTSLGTFCALTNTNSDFTLTEKNEKPDINKLVQEDSEVNNDDEGWGLVNDADIGQQVNYKSTVTVGVGATNYVMHDTMENGLTFNNDVVVKLADGTPVNAANYTVTTPAADGHTFDVAFNNDYIATLAKGTTLTVYYSATLNANANVVDDGNDNTVYLTYGEDHTWETGKHTTTTYTWKMNVEKFAKDGDTEIKLAGAQFQLLDKDGKAIKFTKNGTTYKVAADGAVDTIITDTTGTFDIVGLDEGTYSLHETVAPDGYNKLDKDIAIVITSDYDEDNLEATYELSADDQTTTVVRVENKTGGLFPETGGIGTTIFTVVGALLMIAAAVILVSKKRMSTFA